MNKENISLQKQNTNETLSKEDNVKELRRILPSNIEAERILLGALIIRSEQIYKVNDFLLAEHFYEKIHQNIYRVIESFVNSDMMVNDITISSVLNKEEIFQKINIQEYLLKLTTLAMLVINPNHYGKIIYHLAIKRNLIDIGEEIVNQAYDNSVASSPMEQLESAEKKLYNLSTLGTNVRATKHIGLSVDQALKTINKARSNAKHISGISTGYMSLDRILFGIHKSDLIVIAGRPGMGKTSFAINLAYNLCNSLLKEQAEAEINDANVNQNIMVAFFSLEMSSEQISMKILSMCTSINSDNLRNGNINESSYNDLLKHSIKIKDIPLFIDDNATLSISTLRLKARKLKRQNNLKVLVVDYLQLMQSSSTYQNRVLEISEITQGLKGIAKELDIPVIVLSQLSRSVEQRQDKRPMLYDLRDSGAIEQDADIVIFIYRERYYMNNLEPKEGVEVQEWQNTIEQKYDTAEIIVAKHRNGSIGRVDLNYNPEYSKFSDT